MIWSVTFNPTSGQFIEIFSFCPNNLHTAFYPFPSISAVPGFSLIPV